MAESESKAVAESKIEESYIEPEPKKLLALPASTQKPSIGFRGRSPDLCNGHDGFNFCYLYNGHDRFGSACIFPPRTQHQLYAGPEPGDLDDLTARMLENPDQFSSAWREVRPGVPAPDTLNRVPPQASVEAGHGRGNVPAKKSSGGGNGGTPAEPALRAGEFFAKRVRQTHNPDNYL